MKYAQFTNFSYTLDDLGKMQWQQRIYDNDYDDKII